MPRFDFDDFLKRRAQEENIRREKERADAQEKKLADARKKDLQNRPEVWLVGTAYLYCPLSKSCLEDCAAKKRGGVPRGIAVKKTGEPDHDARAMVQAAKVEAIEWGAKNNQYFLQLNNGKGPRVDLGAQGVLVVTECPTFVPPNGIKNVQSVSGNRKRS